MTSDRLWSEPDSHPTGGLPPTGPAPTALQFESGSPLGGTVPTPVVQTQKSDRRELALTAVLLIAAILAGAASLLPWRDFGRRFGAAATETGWERLDGTMGRGWLAVALATLLAVSGVLIAAGRAKAGRVTATCTGVAMAITAVAEWGLGSDAARTGPGSGLWLQLSLGVGVVLAVGMLGPGDSPQRTGDSPQRN